MANVKKRRFFNTDEKQKDQFYTDENLAFHLVGLTLDILGKDERRVLVEPSAGAGAFLLPMRKSNKAIGIDIDPRHSFVRRGDFLSTDAESLKLPSSKHVVVIGNPPFGFAAGTAIKFFNHAAKMADVIAFVVPRSFKKESIKDKLNLNFHLIYQEDLQRNAFLFQGKPYDVPCCFQIWERRSTGKRQVKKQETPVLFEFVSPNQANFVIRRVGGRAGKTFSVNGASLSSNYYIKTKGISVAKLRSAIDAINFDKERNATAGVRSISKRELVRKINREVTL